MRRLGGGFTLIEVLIALSITAFVATVAYASLSAALSGVEGTRSVAERSYELNRALMILDRDLRQFVPRPIRDEFGDREPALTGGELARFPLSFTRAGWHNPGALARSQLQRVAYRVEDEALWRDSWAVLDRAGDSEEGSVLLLEGVEYLEIRFLPDLRALELDSDRNEGGLDSESWPENWAPVAGSTDGLQPPVALELRLQLEDLGEIRRLYALPPI